MSVNLNKIAKLVNETILLTFLNYQLKTLTKFDKNGFPGSQPKTLEKTENFIINNKDDLYFAEKTDGDRYLLMITCNNLVGTQNYGHMFLVNRKKEYYGLIKTNWINNQEELIKLDNTVLDGELVIDKNKSKPVYYIFDTLMIGNTFFGKENFITRIEKARLFFYDIFINFFECDLFFKVKDIQKVNLENLKNMLEDIRNNKLPHENDGIIFTINNKDYDYGSTNNVQKWKPVKDATVDFLLKEDRLIAFSGPYPFIYDTINLSKTDKEVISKDYKNIKDPIVVIEVKLEKSSVLKNLTKTHYWKFIRTRPGKKRGNEIRTIVGVLNSITEEITEEELLNYFK